MSKEKRPCYLSAFIKKGFIVPALFFAVLFSFLLMVCVEYGVLGQLSIRREYYYVLATLAYFLVILLIYLFVSAKDRRLAFGDSITMGLFLASIIYALYLILYAKNISVVRLVACGIIFVFSLAFMIIASARYNPFSEREIFYTKNNLNAYYHVIFKKYGFFGIYIVAIAITCLSYVFAQIKLEIPAIKKTFTIIYLIIPAIFLVVKTTKKKIDLFDATLFSATIALPPTFILSVFSNPYKFYGTTFYVWVIAFLFVFFFFLIRLLTFDNTPIVLKERKHFKNCKTLDYFYKYSEKFGFLFSLSAGSLLALASVAFSRYAFSAPLLQMLKKITLFIPTYYCLTLIVGTLLVGSMLSIINVKARKITFGDLLNVTCFFYSALTFILSLYVLRTAFALFFACSAFCHLIVLIARVKQYVNAQKR